MKNRAPSDLAETRGAPASDALLLSRQLCFAVYSAGHAMNRVYKPLLAPLGLTYPQYLVMMVLWERDDLTVGEIGTRLHLDSGTLTPLLKRLETAGLLRRARDGDDERQVRVRLELKGRTLREKAEQVPQGVLCAAGMTQDELAVLQEQLSALRDRLNAS